MNCCSKEKHEAPEAETRGRQNCPRCDSKSKGVSMMTVRYMLKGPFQPQVQEKASYRFCLSPTCPVVYFSENDPSVFTRDQLSERVTIKETDDPIPICYCFNFFRHDVEKEIRETGKTTIPDFITAQVKAKNCFCEYTNPQGTCCLGNVSSVVKTILKKEVP
ncbi:MAG: copper chaperone Copz family protein [Deltaproteobacteria bacterium]|nr:copper chaperone Copz family protein [Deltaproteobacteria bacterium]